MPLHDWNKDRAWEDMRTLWATELFRWIKPRLPAPYRASLSLAPPLVSSFAAEETPAPDEEVTAATLEQNRTVLITRQGTLVAALELISPRNKDRPESREAFRNRCVGYLLHGVHLMFVDVHPRPFQFTFADAIAAALEFVATPCPSPCAISYRVGPLAPEVGRYLSIWRRKLTVGEPLPILPLPLTNDAAVLIDLEQTYMRAAADAYL